MKANPILAVIFPRANVNFAADRLQILPERLTPMRADAEPIKIESAEELGQRYQLLNCGERLDL
jgi:hypothetical protein